MWLWCHLEYFIILKIKCRFDCISCGFILWRLFNPLGYNPFRETLTGCVTLWGITGGDGDRLPPVDTLGWQPQNTRPLLLLIDTPGENGTLHIRSDEVKSHFKFCKATWSIPRLSARLRTPPGKGNLHHGTWLQMWRLCGSWSTAIIQLDQGPAHQAPFNSQASKDRCPTVILLACSGTWKTRNDLTLTC